MSDNISRTIIYNNSYYDNSPLNKDSKVNLKKELTKENINTQKVNENPKEKSKKENNMIHLFFQKVHNKNLNNKNYSDKKVILKTDSASNNTALKRKQLQNIKK